jgi:hypothetical protein
MSHRERAPAWRGREPSAAAAGAGRRGLHSRACLINRRREAGGVAERESGEGGRRARVAACWWTGGKQARPGPESEAALWPARVSDLRLQEGGGDKGDTDSATDTGMPALSPRSVSKEEKEGVAASESRPSRARAHGSDASRCPSHGGTFTMTRIPQGGPVGWGGTSESGHHLHPNLNYPAVPGGPGPRLGLCTCWWIPTHPFLPSL